jgi:hypothetical protein
MRNDYSTLEIVKALKIGRERLRDWMNRGYVKPSVEAKGQGTKAVFTRQDVYKVALFKLLVESGFKRGRAANSILGISDWAGVADVEYILFLFFPIGPDGSERNHVISFHDYPTLINCLNCLDESTYRKPFTCKDKNDEATVMWLSERIRTKAIRPYDVMQIVNISTIRKSVDFELDHIESNKK